MLSEVQICTFLNRMQNYARWKGSYSQFRKSITLIDLEWNPLTILASARD